MLMQPTPVPSRDFLSVGEVADELHVTDRFVRRLIADGELPAVRVGHRIVRVTRREPGASSAVTADTRNCPETAI